MQKQCENAMWSVSTGLCFNNSGHDQNLMIMFSSIFAPNYISTCLTGHPSRWDKCESLFVASLVIWSKHTPGQRGRCGVGKWEGGCRGLSRLMECDRGLQRSSGVRGRILTVHSLISPIIDLADFTDTLMHLCILCCHFFSCHYLT